MPEEVIKFIGECVTQYGRAKLLLKRNQYFIETSDKQTLTELLKIEVVRREYDKSMAKRELEEAKKDPVIAAAETAPKAAQVSYVQPQNASQGYYFLQLEENDDEDVEEEEETKVVQFEVENLEEVKHQCLGHNLPLLEEYEFKDDTALQLRLDLLPTTQVRPYQEQSLSKMLSGRRARSGIIVLPCGAGKTLVGISAMCTIKKPTIILCNASMAVDQWAGEIRKWTNATEQGVKIVRLTSQLAGKDMMFDANRGEAGILIATYSILATRTKHSENAALMIQKIRSIDWGLLIADEVQMFVAKTYRDIIDIKQSGSKKGESAMVRAHCKLGLTATLVRSDEKIDDLGYLVGPKLYEANWQQLQSMGYLARVQCYEVWCQMTPEFFMEYIKLTVPQPGSQSPAEDERRALMLYVSNPNKYVACQYLIQKHEKRGDKIIVFFNSVNALLSYAKRLHKNVIYGKTNTADRIALFDEFRNAKGAYTLFLSDVGDKAVDLPSANVIIQVSIHFGAQMQEAQRLGRILRPKEDAKSEYNAFFYTLTSKNTKVRSQRNDA